MYPAQEGARDAARESGVDLVVFSSLNIVDHGTTNAVQFAENFPFYRRDLDGLIVGFNSHILPPQSNLRWTRGLPIVLLAREHEEIPYVVADIPRIFQQAVRELVAVGHRDIVFLGDEANIGISHERKQGYLAGLAEAGIKPKPELMIPGGFGEYRGFEAAVALLRSKTRFTALIAACDAAAIGAMKAFRTAGLRIPEDVALIGFDGTIESAHTSPPLTTFWWPARDMGFTAAKLLAEKIQHGTPLPPATRIPLQMFRRESCGTRRLNSMNSSSPEDLVWESLQAQALGKAQVRSILRTQNQRYFEDWMDGLGGIPSIENRLSQLSDVLHQFNRLSEVQFAGLYLLDEPKLSPPRRSQSGYCYLWHPGGTLGQRPRRRRFKLSDISPQAILLELESPATVVIFPLVIHREHLGFLIVDMMSDGHWAFSGIARTITHFLFTNHLHLRLLEQTEKFDQARKEADAARIEAEDANLAKSKFLSHISHEIRTPLNSILGMAELTMLGPLTGDQRGFLEVIHSSGNNLLHILNDVLDLSRVAAGKLRIDSIPFAVRPCVREAISAFAHASRSKKITIQSRISNKVPQVLMGDPLRIRQILTNLIGNAIKFTEEGKIMISVKPQEEDVSQVTLDFSVTDSGIGIAAEKLTAIFEEFTQADNSTTRRFGGTGLGLAICQRLVHLMGGKISVQSREGKGSTFIFTIPFPRSEALAAEAMPQQPTSPNLMKPMAREE